MTFTPTFTPTFSPTFSPLVATPFSPLVATPFSPLVATPFSPLVARVGWAASAPSSPAPSISRTSTSTRETSCVAPRVSKGSKTTPRTKTSSATSTATFRVLEARSRDERRSVATTDGREEAMVSIASRLDFARVTSSLCPWRARCTPRRRIAAGLTTTRKTRRLARKTRRFDRLGSSRRRSRVRPRESRARRSRHATFTTTMRLVDRTCRANRWDRCSGTSVAVAGRRKIGKIRRRRCWRIWNAPGDASDAGSASGVGMDPGLDLGAGGSRGRGRRPRVVARRRRRRRRRRRTSGCEKCACASNNAEGRCSDPTWRREGSDQDETRDSKDRTRGAEGGVRHRS